jgi:hypothetical protein
MDRGDLYTQPSLATLDIVSFDVIHGHCVNFCVEPRVAMDVCSDAILWHSTAMDNIAGKPNVCRLLLTRAGE